MKWLEVELSHICKTENIEHEVHCVLFWNHEESQNLKLRDALILNSKVKS